jgi:hypothetical protein
MSCIRMTASAAPVVLASARGVTARTVTVQHLDALLLDCSGPALTLDQRAILADACDAIKEGDRSATCVVVAGRLVAAAAGRVVLGRPVAVPVDHLDIDATIASMRLAGRTTLIHYAGAAHRDPVAHRMCIEWLADPAAGEATLKSRALLAVHGWVVSPEQLRAASGQQLADRKAAARTP